MYKPYLSRQKSGKSVQTTASAGDKTTLKLVTEQLRASQKVLNKSDQFIASGAALTRGCCRSVRPPLPPAANQVAAEPAGPPAVPTLSPHLHTDRATATNLPIAQLQPVCAYFYQCVFFVGIGKSPKCNVLTVEIFSSF